MGSLRVPRVASTVAMSALRLTSSHMALAASCPPQPMGTCHAGSELSQRAAVPARWRSVSSFWGSSLNAYSKRGTQMLQQSLRIRRQVNRGHGLVVRAAVFDQLTTSLEQVWGKLKNEGEDDLTTPFISWLVGQITVILLLAGLAECIYG